MRNGYGWLLLFLLFGQGLIAQNENRFEPEIRAFEQADSLDPPKPNGILFLGSSSIRRWSSLVEDFEGYPVLNRGFGGSQCLDAIYFFNRVVAPYRPMKIALYEGDNDLASGKTPDQILSYFKTFVGLVNYLNDTTEVAFIAIKPSPARWHLAEEMREANRMIKEYCDQDERLTYIDVFTPMLNDQEEPKAYIFTEDQLHMNTQGYQIWKTALEPFVTQ
ncbi:MAG: SGNH/GDSL hydrolase family protein [Cyclobacteriaceae bacterium]